MGTITIIIVCGLIISLILSTLRKIYDWLSGVLKAKDGTLELPSPPAYPLLRHFPYFLDHFEDDKKLINWAKTYKKEGLFTFDPLLGPKRICVFKEDFIKQILVKNCFKYDRSQVLAQTFPKIKQGVFMSSGKEHVWQRKMLNPAFSLASILKFIPLFNVNTNNLIKLWRENSRNSLTRVAEVDILSDFSKLSLDIIGEAAFGYKFNTLTTGENEVSQAVACILFGKLSVWSRVVRRLIPFYDKLPFKENTRLKEADAITNRVVKEIIKEKQELLKDVKDIDCDAAKDLLGKMVMMQDQETGRRLTDECLEAQVYTFMVAGHETTSVGLTWTFFLLAKHPAIQEKAREEAKRILGDSEVVTGEHLEKLEYITAVINESLRMYPPAAVFLREVMQEDQLGDYKIPKGAYIIIPICVLHHLEENWPNHDQFDPDRFLNQGDKQPLNYKFMPFSNGPRNCIGRKFAVLEMQVVVTKLLSAFKFELDPNQGKIGTQLRLSLKPHPKPILRVSPIQE